MEEVAVVEEVVVDVEARAVAVVDVAVLPRPLTVWEARQARARGARARSQVARGLCILPTCFRGGV